MATYYAQIVYLQDDEARPYLTVIEDRGAMAALRELESLYDMGDCGGGDVREHDASGGDDQRYESERGSDGVYILTWNPDLEYVSLQWAYDGDEDGNPTGEEPDEWRNATSRTLHIEIEMENAAFFSGPRYEGPEVARILREFADRIEDDARLPGVLPLYDINGNRVGFADARETED